MSRHAHFDANPVRDVRIFPPTPPSPTYSTSSDEGPITPPTYSVTLSRTSNVHHTLSPLAPATYHPSVSPRDPLVYIPSRTRGSPQRPVSPTFSTPSPKATSVHVHPALASFRWDPRRTPPAYSPSTRDKPATHPPLPKVVLSTGHLPWTVTVRAPSTSTIVTVGDVLDALHANLRAPVTRTEWNAAHDRKDTIRKAFSRRCGDDAKERGEGVRRVDYLPEGVLFTGLGPYLGASEENLSIEVTLRSR